MKKNLVYLFAFFLSFTASAQNQLFFENFEVPSNTFSLNTLDLNSVSSGSNYWIINNSFSGGSGTLNCLGFPFGFTVSATPNQTSPIVNQPNSQYLHIVSDAAVSSGISNASFVAADGFCNFDENYFAGMSSDISTIGSDSVEFSFYWLCSGSNANYGEVYYSTNNGTSWTLITSPISQYFQQSSWTEQKISLPNFAQQNSLRFGFRFVNGTSSAATDPSFAVDEIKINGFTVQNNNITTSALNNLSYCPGDTLSVFYSASGNFTSTNIFSVELSDVGGSFANPITIGTLASSTPNTILATIPANQPAGSNYRIRVVSNSPSTIGTDNGADISIGQNPVAGVIFSSADSICSGNSVTISLNNSVGTNLIWEESNNGINFSSSSFSGNSFNSGNLTQDMYLRAIVSNSCGSDTSGVISVTVLALPQPSFSANPCNCTTNDVSFSNLSTGNIQSVLWNFGDGNSSNQNNPTHQYAQDGTYAVTLTITDALGCTASFTDSVSSFVLSAVNNFSDEHLFEIFPNPTSSEVNLILANSEIGNADLRLFTPDGRVIQAASKLNLMPGTNKIHFDQKLNDGLYILELSMNGRIQHKKLIIKN